MIRHLYALPKIAQQILALIVLMTLIIIPLLGLNGFLAHYRENVEAIENKRFQLGKLVSFNAGKIQTPPDSKAVTAGEYLPAGSASGLAADLQVKMKLFAAQAGTRLKATSNAQSIIEDEIDYIGVRLLLDGTYQQVANMILAIETSQPYLLIKEAQIRQSSRPINNKEPILDVTLSVYGAVTEEVKKSYGTNQ